MADAAAIDQKQQGKATYRSSILYYFIVLVLWQQCILFYLFAAIRCAQS